MERYISHFDNSSCLINDKLVPDDDNTAFLIMNKMKNNLEATKVVSETMLANYVRDNEGDVMEEDVRGNNEDTAVIDKDNKRDSLGKDEYEGNDEKKNIEKLEAITNQKTKKSMKGIHGRESQMKTLKGRVKLSRF